MMCSQATGNAVRGSSFSMLGLYNATKLNCSEISPLAVNPSVYKFTVLQCYLLEGLLEEFMLGS